MFTRNELRDVIHHRRSGGPIPGWYDYFATETQTKYGRVLAELVRQYPDDFLRFSPADGPEFTDSRGTDVWGCEFITSQDGAGTNVGTLALDDWAGLDAYLKRIPNPNRQGRWDQAKAMLADADRRYKLGVFWLSLFERLHVIRGMGNLFLDFYEHPRELNRLLDPVEQYLLTTIDQFASFGMDGVLLGEDWGMQDRLMVSPDMWRRWFKPRYKTIFDRIHSLGMDVWLHSCGKIDDILGDWIELGLDVIHPLQYGCVDWDRASGLYRGKVCFLGTIDVTHVLTSGTPGEIADHVGRIVSLFGNDAGGLILAPGNTILPETPLENIRALFEAMDKYR
ncbi:MAG: hypothetical protein HQ546_03455 [Planctomycetes bacterium]|nr:hypothetical protein [Planctomycetota bacterium]